MFIQLNSHPQMLRLCLTLVGKHVPRVSLNFKTFGDKEDWATPLEPTGLVGDLQQKVAPETGALKCFRLFAKLPGNLPAGLVQSLNSPFFPPHIGAEPRRAKRESRITCMRTLRTDQSKITRPLSTRFHTTLLASMCSAMLFSARTLKK